MTRHLINTVWMGRQQIEPDQPPLRNVSHLLPSHLQKSGYVTIQLAVETTQQLTHSNLHSLIQTSVS